MKNITPTLFALVFITGCSSSDTAANEPAPQEVDLSIHYATGDGGANNLSQGEGGDEPLKMTPCWFAGGDHVAILKINQPVGTYAQCENGTVREFRSHVEVEAEILHDIGGASLPDTPFVLGYIPMWPEVIETDSTVLASIYEINGKKIAVGRVSVILGDDVDSFTEGEEGESPSVIPELPETLEDLRSVFRPSMARADVCVAGELFADKTRADIVEAYLSPNPGDACTPTGTSPEPTP